MLMDGREHGAHWQLWDGKTASHPWKAWLPVLQVPAQMPHLPLYFQQPGALGLGSALRLSSGQGRVPAL